MKLSSFWTGLDWDNWLYNLAKGILSGGANSANATITAALIDSSHWALGSPNSWKMVWGSWLLGAMMFTFAFMSKSGLPDKKRREETLEVIHKGDQPVAIKKTTHDTSVVPLDAPPTPAPKVEEK